MITKKRRKQIEKLAVKTRKKLTLDEKENLRLPSYLRLFDIDLGLADLSAKSVNAYLTYDVKKKKPKIYVDAHQSPEQFLYSLVHEMGHLLLEWQVDITSAVMNMEEIEKKQRVNKDERLLATSYKSRDRDGERDDSGSDDARKEAEADYFATCFLMPRRSTRSLLRWACEPKLDLLDAISTIAWYFDVEQRRAHLRINELMGKEKGQ
ncbi:ImmA/IrrE family metallo-endopeptidase [Fructobacillus sp. W13]|uniref:ImmA/IrrE family metallo-endopeptidase n=1 Tax=Fructobacillus apis TaxID=2935017 RepID=A0ABT0ZRG0_9LACO|nr:ImmA/IrrE family metallo-endopeptidase [Fructobacillus apis]MCO0832584.1 ImmA/IrrE family metallo-endopeptidase [Fructobacillus apis]